MILNSELSVFVWNRYSNTWGTYRGLGQQCGELVTWVNCERTSDSTRRALCYSSFVSLYSRQHTHYNMPVRAMLGADQSYSDRHFSPSVIDSTYASIASAYGKGAADWSKVAWGASTQIGQSRPTPAAGNTLMRELQRKHPDARGVFVWTAEYSSRSKPAWCFEDQMAMVMRGDVPSGACSH